MELIKAILLETEDSEANPIPSKYSEKEILYHINLCIEANLVHGHITEDAEMEIYAAATWRLTWEGHEFLDTARNSTIWNKTLATLKQSAIEVPFTILKALLAQQVKTRIGLEI